MIPPNRSVYVLAMLVIASFLEPSASAAGSEEYSAANPPPASFVFAGPVGGMVDESGNGTVFFRFVAIIHSLKPTRIQILDADSKAVLVDDANPTLNVTPHKHPSKPKVSIFQWEGRSPVEMISESEPGWLHDGKPTVVNLEIRIFEGRKLKFSFTQPATYAAAVKAQILHAVEYNKSLDAKK